MSGVNVEKRGNKWRYRFNGASIDGKRKVYQKGGFDTKKEALAAGNEALARYNGAGVIFKPKEISFSDYLDIWMREYCDVNLKPETILNYTKRIRCHIKPALGAYKITALNPSILQEFINGKFNSGYSRNTLTTLKGILRGSLAYAVDSLEYLSSNPAEHLKVPSGRAQPDVPTRYEPHVYVPKERFDEIIARFPEGTSAHIPLLLGYKCGLRLGETFALVWEDIDIDNRKLTVNRQIQWDASKGLWYFTLPKYSSVRTIDIDEELACLLERTRARQRRFEACYEGDYIRYYKDCRGYIQSQSEGDEVHFVMVRDKGDYIQSRIMQHTSSIIHYQLKYPEFDYHSLRHTHATMLVEAGAPMKYVQERLGHKQVETTVNIYQHCTGKIADQGRKKLDDLFG